MQTQKSSLQHVLQSCVGHAVAGCSDRDNVRENVRGISEMNEILLILCRRGDEIKYIGE